MNNKGFTLIEITIALLILAIGLVGILALFPVGFDASGRAANITEATFLAQERIEDLKREGYAGPTVVAALTTTVPRPHPALKYGSFAPDQPNYEYDMWAYDVTGIADLREVIVCVYWPANAGDEADRSGQRFVELSTYLAKYGP